MELTIKLIKGKIFCVKVYEVNKIMINGMDKEYVSVCMNYIREWIAEYEVQDWEISRETVEYIIENGGDGIRDLEECFKKLVKTAKEYQITHIDKAFIDTVIS